jgi:cytochrome c-type biogenesis protein CcmH/NrfG
MLILRAETVNMKEQKNAGEGYVKKETLLVVSIIAFIAGFFGGVLLTIYKSSPPDRLREAPMSEPAAPNQNIDIDRALRILDLEKKTSAAPDDAEAWIQLGNLYFDAGNQDKAISAYKKSLALKPGNADVLTDMGVMYRRSGRPRKAIDTFDRAIKVEPGHEIARFNKGVVLMHDLNDAEGAIKAWEELIALNPNARTPSGQSVKGMLQKFKQGMNRRGSGG